MTKKRLSIKQLESYLQNLDDFESPKVGLEQYATPPHIAAHMLDIVNSNYNDLEGKFVADLGCGTGRLSVGSLLCGATYVIGFDIDGDALRTSLQSLGEGESDEDIGSCAYQSFPNLNFIQADVADESADDFWRSFEDKFDTVIMNPPFGTKVNAGLDMVFLKRALKLTTGVVYSLHKTSTRKVSISVSFSRDVM